MNGLTAKQNAFLAAYIGEARGVGVHAARAAGYAGDDNALNVAACRLLRNATILAAVAEDKARVRREGIASREERIKSQNIRWEKMHAVIASRAESYAAEPAPGAGATTGLVVRQYKMVGSGPSAQLMEEWVLDAGLLGEMRQLEQHTAKELGQWVDKAAVTDPTGEHAANVITLVIDRAGHEET